MSKEKRENTAVDIGQQSNQVLMEHMVWMVSTALQYMAVPLLFIN
jgi:hypothetical protein